jgi:hypothetical protein
MKKIGNIEKALLGDGLLIETGDISINQHDLASLKKSDHDCRYCGPALEYITPEFLNTLEGGLTTKSIRSISKAWELSESSSHIEWLKKPEKERDSTEKKIDKLTDDLCETLRGLEMAGASSGADEISQIVHRVSNRLSHIPHYSRKPRDTGSPRRVFIGSLWSNTNMPLADIASITTLFFDESTETDMVTTVENTVKRLQKQGFTRPQGAFPRISLKMHP